MLASDIFYGPLFLSVTDFTCKLEHSPAADLLNGSAGLDLKMISFGGAHEETADGFPPLGGNGWPIFLLNF
jgi:hypothetical protein